MSYQQKKKTLNQITPTVT